MLLAHAPTQLANALVKPSEIRSPAIGARARHGSPGIVEHAPAALETQVHGSGCALEIHCTHVGRAPRTRAKRSVLAPCSWGPLLANRYVGYVARGRRQLRSNTLVRNLQAIQARGRQGCVRRTRMESSRGHVAFKPSCVAARPVPRCRASAPGPPCRGHGDASLQKHCAHLEFAMHPTAARGQDSSQRDSR